MTHDKYNELQTRLDKIFSDFLDEVEDIETEQDVLYMRLWVDNHIKLVSLWARINGADDNILSEIKQDSITLMEMLVC